MTHYCQSVFSNSAQKGIIGRLLPISVSYLFLEICNRGEEGPWPEKQGNWLGHPATYTLTDAVYFDLLIYWN